jgi:hypothetical protein
MSDSIVTTYYVKMKEAGDAPAALYRWIRDTAKRTIQERFWNQKDKEWQPTNSVTESRLTGGDVEPYTEEDARKHFPEAFKV